MLWSGRPAVYEEIKKKKKQCNPKNDTKHGRVITDIIIIQDKRKKINKPFKPAKYAYDSRHSLPKKLRSTFEQIRYVVSKPQQSTAESDQHKVQKNTTFTGIRGCALRYGVENCAIEYA